MPIATLVSFVSLLDPFWLPPYAGAVAVVHTLAIGLCVPAKSRGWRGWAFGAIDGLLSLPCIIVLTAIAEVTDFRFDGASGVLALSGLIFLPPFFAVAILESGHAPEILFLVSTLSTGVMTLADLIFDGQTRPYSGLDFVIKLGAISFALWVSGWIAFAFQRKRILLVLALAALPVLIILSLFSTR